MSASTERSHQRFLIVFVAVSSIVGVVFSLSYLILLRTYEVSTYAEIIDAQVEAKGIYGSALNPNDLKYKVSLVKKIKPDVVVLGSSRTMQFRSPVFTRSFVNCGGVFKNLDEGKTFLKMLFREHVPKFVLLGVDYWWFNRDLEIEPARYQLDETLVSAQKLIKPFEWLWLGKFSIQDYFNILIHGPQPNGITSYKNFGVHAIKNSSGFRADGSYLNTGSIFKTDRLAEMEKELNEIKTGLNTRANHGYGAFVDRQRLVEFAEMIDTITSRGVELVIIIPPVAPMFLEILRQDREKKFGMDLFEKINSLHNEVYDFTDSRSFASIDTEYYDGWHGGDVVYLRILEQIITKAPNSKLVSYLKRDVVRTSIKKFKGRSLVLFDDESRLFMKQEPQLSRIGE